jgi:hypothetical protein
LIVVLVPRVPVGEWDIDNVLLCCFECRNYGLINMMTSNHYSDATLIFATAIMGFDTYFVANIFIMMFVLIIRNVIIKSFGQTVTRIMFFGMQR